MAAPSPFVSSIDEADNDGQQHGAAKDLSNGLGVVTYAHCLSQDGDEQKT